MALKNIRAQLALFLPTSRQTKINALAQGNADHTWQVGDKGIFHSFSPEYCGHPLYVNQVYGVVTFVDGDCILVRTVGWEYACRPDGVCSSGFGVFIKGD